MWGPDKFLNLHLGESFDITGRGKVVVCSLKENGYTEGNFVDRLNLNKEFMDKVITFNNAWWIIKGIESHAAMNRPHEKIGFLIREWGLWHQIKTDFGPDAGMIMTGKYCSDFEFDKYGMDGQYFDLALSCKFKPHDTLTVGYHGIEPVIITDEPIEHIIEDGEHGKCEYWVHKAQLFTNKTGTFIPRKYMLPGTIFKRIK